MSNPFYAAMNAANKAAAAICGETFIIERGAFVGECTAVNIEDLEAGNSLMPGVLRGDNSVQIYIDRTVFENARLGIGAVLQVRNKRVKVNTVTDEGDDTLILQCNYVGAGKFTA